jgi:hypothetical protein
LPKGTANASAFAICTPRLRGLAHNQNNSPSGFTSLDEIVNSYVNKKLSAASRLVAVRQLLILHRFVPRVLTSFRATHVRARNVQLVAARCAVVLPDWIR